MRYWVGVTDSRWLQFVRSNRFEEVNFWQPSPRPPFTSLPAGTPFLFKRKAPHNDIVGGGAFVRLTNLPLVSAWEAFGGGNGTASLGELLALISSIRHEHVAPSAEVACNVVTQVFYLPIDKSISAAPYFPASIMRGKIFDSDDGPGAELWAKVQDAWTVTGVSRSGVLAPERYGREFLARARLGQGAFRTLVTDAYQRRCAITGESTLPVLEAAHIKPYAEDGAHHVTNGLLLRSDFHKLFDLGLVTVDPDYKVRVSPRIHEQWYNGKAYYRLDGQELAVVPSDNHDWPDRDLLRWHNTNCFSGASC